MKIRFRLETDMESICPRRLARLLRWGGVVGGEPVRTLWCFWFTRMAYTCLTCHAKFLYALAFGRCPRCFSTRLELLPFVGSEADEPVMVAVESANCQKCSHPLRQHIADAYGERRCLQCGCVL